ncbi:MAG: HigA family addiction module antitoxin [Pseudomonadales bacterium]
MAMFNPPHPGRLVLHKFIRDEDGNELNSVANVAKQLGCHRNTLNQLITGKTAVSIEMALALEKNKAGSAEMWLTMQMNYDLFALRQAAA